MTVERPEYDDSLWTSTETALLAGMAFAQLDDMDYSNYLSDPERGVLSAQAAGVEKGTAPRV